MTAIPPNLYAWITEGEDSFMGVLIKNKWYPLVSTKLDNAEKMLPLVIEATQLSGIPARLVDYKLTGTLKIVKP